MTGDRHQEPITTLTDPVTGRPVRRLTDPSVHAHHPYFYYRSFTPDGRKVLYVSYRTGKACAYLLNIPTGESVQLTDTDDLAAFVSTLDPTGRFLYHVDGPELRRLDIASLNDEVVHRQEPPYDGTPVYPGYSHDARYALLAQMHRDDVVKQDDGWGYFEPQWRARPRCRLVYLDLATGEQHMVLEEALWLGHPQIRPGHADQLLYCHEGPGHLIDARLWAIRSDGSGKRCLGHREPEPGAGAGDTVTHEYFTPDGREIAFVLIPGDRSQPRSLRLMNADTFEERDLGEMHSYLHMYHSPDGTRIVGDEHTADHPQDCIWVWDLARNEERRLCLHGSSLHPRGASTQDAHPHPCFAPDNRHVLFTTDREAGPDGPCSVYLADADGLFG